IVGAGREYSVGDTGGAKEVTLTIDQIPPHSHNITLRGTQYTGHIHSGDTVAGTPGGTSGTWTGSTQSAGSGAAHENRPPYYALAYIMRVATSSPTRSAPWPPGRVQRRDSLWTGLPTV